MRGEELVHREGARKTTKLLDSCVAQRRMNLLFLVILDVDQSC